jgi:hypothetical protein
MFVASIECTKVLLRRLIAQETDSRICWAFLLFFAILNHSQNVK